MTDERSPAGEQPGDMAEADIANGENPDVARRRPVPGEDRDDERRADVEGDR